MEQDSVHGIIILYFYIRIFYLWFSFRDSLQRAKDNLLRLLSTAVKTTLVTEETITSRLETLIEQTMRDEDQDSDTVSEVNSISEAEDSIPEGFRRRQGVPSLATSTPAVGVSTARALGTFHCLNMPLLLQSHLLFVRARG